MLRVENASVVYGQVTAVREVSLTVNDGDFSEWNGQQAL